MTSVHRCQKGNCFLYSNKDTYKISFKDFIFAVFKGDTSGIRIVITK